MRDVCDVGAMGVPWACGVAIVTSLCMKPGCAVGASCVRAVCILCVAGRRRRMQRAGPSGTFFSSTGWVPPRGVRDGRGQGLDHLEGAADVRPRRLSWRACNPARRVACQFAERIALA